MKRKPRPCVRLRELLAASKAEGIPFDEAWPSALSQMTREKSWPHATIERRQWREALDASRPEYRRCYQDEPSTFSNIVSAILTRAEPEQIVAEDGVVDALALA
jgi:hypothetical protein